VRFVALVQNAYVIYARKIVLFYVLTSTSTENPRSNRGAVLHSSQSMQLKTVLFRDINKI